MPFVFSLLVLAFSIVTLIDIITRDEGQVKHLPKLFWIILAIIIPVVGGICWWAVGREYPERPVRQAPAYSSGGRGASTPRVRIVDDRRMDARTTEQQLADLEREIEEERLRAEIARRRSERGEA
ncbi:PLD nuclease N-terminal domain-containing protein [Microbacterium marinilacus]|uniref:Cardiolipin synthase N-terminal domain-containing protein n=1 Tax=Microbacterium marinilacus TaxID=415209 RepID=A0ABP7BK04_9MICO|nr:PLD nuclease N-terminal domain-containing protein [Microbacterium marinilacus]MBY0690137.1 PLD nuclease N-terminal domain-containing protein [Microbacterium marinilacus]